MTNLYFTSIATIFFFSLFPVSTNTLRKYELTRMRRTLDLNQIKGYPDISNCYDIMSYFTENPLYLKDPFKMEIIWHFGDGANNPSKEDLPELFSYYNISYEIFQDDDLETHIDLSVIKKSDSLLFFPGSYFKKVATYVIYPSMVPKKQGLPVFKKQDAFCFLAYTDMKPKAIIDGGSRRTLPPNKEIFFNGKNSINYNNLDNSNKGLRYEWLCGRSLDNPSVCDQQFFSTKDTAIMPASDTGPDQVISITLNIYTESDSMDTAMQRIIMDIKAGSLEIKCEKNCPPLTNISNLNEPTFFRAIYQNEKQKINPDTDLEWEIQTDVSDFSINYATDTDFGEKGEKFSVKPGVFLPGVYEVYVNTPEVYEGFADASITVKFDAPPNITKCSIDPESGKSLETLFQLSCNYDDPPILTYEIFSQNLQNGLEETLISDYQYSSHFTDPPPTFKLPPSKDFKYIVRIFKGNGPFVELNINANVTSTIVDKPQNEAVDHVENFYNKSQESVSALVKSKNSSDRNSGYDKFHVLVDELVLSNDNGEMTDFIKDLKYSAVQDLLNSDIYDANDILQMGESLSKLMKKNELKQSDTRLTKFTTTICNKMITNHVNAIKKEKYPLAQAGKTQKISKSLTKCLESNLNPNFESITSLPPINITNVPLIPQEKDITEQYSDYVDFSDEYYQNVDNMRQATDNIIKGSALTAKAVALTTAIGEKFIQTTGNKSGNIVAKDLGKYLLKSNLSLFGVTLFATEDFAGSDHPFDILMSVWIRDIVWWNPAHTKVATDIVNIEIWHSTCRDQVLDLEKPITVLFDITENFDNQTEVIDEILQFSPKLSEMSGEQLSRQIKVKRIDIPSGSSIRIQFQFTNSKSFDVVFTYFKFPTIEDFSEKIKMSKDGQSSISVTNTENYDIWGYLGVLPNSKENILNYNVSFEFVCCIQWETNRTRWLPACMTGDNTNSTMIICKCNHTYTLAGYLQNIKTLPQEVLPIELVLQLISFIIIFITVAITFGLYLILVLLTFFSREKQIYYLGDNLSNHLFVYLVEIKTGNGLDSGTTSNIVMKLKGTKSSSNPHVLNYPDLRMRMLQQFGEDTFVVTTKHHLGNLLKIELWFDCIGPQPSWYCDYVRVYDLQTREEWIFNVQKRLTLFKKSQVFISAPVFKNYKDLTIFEKILANLKCCNKWHTWVFIYRDESISYFKRVSILFSTIILTYMFLILFMGIPEFQLRDGLDSFELTIGSYEIFVSIASSFLSFLVHITITWGFRCSKIQFSEFNQKRKKSFIYTIICWGAIIALIIPSFTFIIVYGFWIPPNKSLEWLVCAIIGIFLIALVYENLLIFGLNFICKKQNWESTVWDSLEQICNTINIQRTYLYGIFGKLLLRPYFTHLYKPLSADEIKAKKLIVTRRREVIAEIMDLLMFFVYIIFLYIVMLANKDRYLIKSKIEMTYVMEGHHTRSTNFSSVKTVTDLKRYIQTTLIPSLHPLRWYDHFDLANPGLMVDVTNKFIGIVRLRQHRIIANFCEEPAMMDFLKLGCYPEYSIDHQQTKNFGYGWGNITFHLEYDRMAGVWNYSTKTKTGSLGVIGEITTYPGGGYMAYLGRTLYNSLANFRNLVKKYWLDEKTRSVFIEFLAYNANYNVFTAVRLLFERSASGLTTSRIYVFPVRMLFVKGSIRSISIVFFILFIIWVGLLFLKQSFTAVRNIKSFYKDIWFLIDLVIIAMSIGCIILFAARTKMIGEYLDTLEELKHNEFTNYFYLFYLEDFLSVFAAILVCIATIRLWKFLRFGKKFRLMERTLSISAIPLLSITAIFFWFVIGFSLYGVLIYGNEFYDFASVLRVIRLLVRMCLKPNELDLSDFTKFSIISFPYFSCYLILMFVLLYIYIIIIIMSYAQAQIEFSTQIPVYNIQNYIVEQIHYVPKLFKYKFGHLEGGAEDKKIVTPKIEALLHAKCISIDSQKIAKMKLVTICILRKNPQNCDHLMKEVCTKFAPKTFTRVEKVELFYKGLVAGERIRIISEKKIENVAKAAELILNSGSEDERKIAVSHRNNEIKRCVKIVKQNQEILKKCDLLLHLCLFKMNIVSEEFKKL